MDFLVHNGSRTKTNRALRARSPEHGGFKHYVFNNTQRLISARPLLVTEEKLKQHLEELKEKQAKGLLYVTTPQYEVVDLDTLSIIAAPAPEGPKPNPPLDSAARDKQVGWALNSIPQEVPPPAEFVMPVNAPVAALENPIAEVAVVEPELALVDAIVPADKVDTTPQSPQGKQKKGNR